TGDALCGVFGRTNVVNVMGRERRRGMVTVLGFDEGSIRLARVRRRRGTLLLARLSPGDALGDIYGAAAAVVYQFSLDPTNTRDGIEQQLALHFGRDVIPVVRPRPGRAIPPGDPAQHLHRVVRFEP